MKYFILLLLTISQVACVSASKLRPNIALYDFSYTENLDSKQKLIAKIDVDEITAIEALNYQKIRYRLNYKNAARVFYYTESRWTSTPAELIGNQLTTLLQRAEKPSNCSLRLKLQLFDHVFTSENSSSGVVQMNSTLLVRKTKQVIANDTIVESVPAITANAEGGTKALAQASEHALIKAVNWANAQAEHNPLCE